MVEQLVRDVAAKHGRIRVFAASTLLRIDDVPLGVEILRAPKFKALSLAEVQPGVLSSPKPAKEVLAALRAAGHAPVGERAASGARPARKPITRRASSPPRATPSAEDVAARLQAAPVRTTPKAPGPRPPAAQVFSLDRYRIEQRLGHLTDLEVGLLAEATNRGSRIEIDYLDTAGDLTTRVIAEVTDEGRLLTA